MIGSLIQASPILDDLPPFSKEINEPYLEMLHRQSGGGESQLVPTIPGSLMQVDKR